MRSQLTFALATAIVAWSTPSRADITGCFLGPPDLNRCSVSGTIPAVLGAIAAPILIAGAAATIVHELDRRTEERPAAAPIGAPTRAPNLSFLPSTASVGQPEAARPPNPAFRFNEN